MPLVASSSYVAPVLLRNGHVQTVLNAFRPAPEIAYERERIDTPDGDFLELDWRIAGRSRLVIVSYGMESAPSTPYVRGAVAALHAAEFDVVVWNYRGCGGTPNRKEHFYHGGLIDDLHAVVQRGIARGYRDIRLAGFSLGGNLLLNYLGRMDDQLPSAVCRAVAFSVPVDVAACAVQLRQPANRIYARLFLRSFRRKIRAKMAAMPDRVNDHAFDSIATLEDYDEHYTVPHFGFGTVPAMYHAVSSLHVLHQIRTPVLLVNAQDDPFMGPTCFPSDIARVSDHLFLEMPRHGGHLGFLEANLRSWMERRVVEFLTS